MKKHKKMPRDARVVCAGVPHHVTQRGNYRQDIFDEEEDREKYMEFFMKYREKFNVKLYAWCLMSNHVHFVVEPSTEKGLADLFKFTHMRYSMYFNRKKRASGHLFQGRFYSSPLDADHMYEALRYVELNPLRAGIISRVDAYKWSSMKMRLTGKGKYALSSVHEYVEIDDWKAYLKEKCDEEILKTLRERTRTNRPSGDVKFIKKIEKLSGQTFNFSKKGRPKKKKI